jgi:nucleoside-diphosphate-sugar epimerase
MPLAPLCLTGGSGFVGQRLVGRLADLGVADVTLLLRDPSRMQTRYARPGWRFVAADLTQQLPADAIARGSTVIHLASATGTAAPKAMQLVNVEGTRHVLAAAERAKARLFLHVSSIAAAYRDKRSAPYATSKAEAELSVSSATIPHTLVRPTMVFGPGSPNQAALRKLATLAFPLLPGEGHVRVQPIHVDDLVEALIYLAGSAPVGASPVPIGGPTQLTMRELYAAMRRAHGLPAREPRTLPLEAIRRVLALLGGLTASRFPVSAGQFVAFANDSTADDVPRAVQLPPPRISLEEMLAPGADA